jgi:hypothetical protein
MSLCAIAQATPSAWRQPAREDHPAAMFRRPLLLLVLVLLLALVGGLLVIGAFPPPATQQPVERTLPNERFTTR